MRAMRASGAGGACKYSLVVNGPPRELEQCQRSVSSLHADAGAHSSPERVNFSARSPHCQIALLVAVTQPQIIF